MQCYSQCISVLDLVGSIPAPVQPSRSVMVLVFGTVSRHRIHSSDAVLS